MTNDPIPTPLDGWREPARHSEYSVGHRVRYSAEGREKVGVIESILCAGHVAVQGHDPLPLQYVISWGNDFTGEGFGCPDFVGQNEILGVLEAS